MPYVSYLDGLNPQQKEAAEHTDGPLMILAGAGAGKTKTITHRIAHLIAQGTAPESILAVTFTNKAAGEMKERVGELLRSMREANLPLSSAADVRLPHVSTFHALGVRILREFASELNLPRSFSIWDRADSQRAIKAALTDLGMEKQYEAKSILGRISREKGNARVREDFTPGTQNPWEEAVAAVWEKYDAALAREKALDFDDLLLKTLVLLREKPAVLAKLRERWRYVTIDEYQDTNQVQFEIARLLAEPKNNICVVGDIDQNIYTWRGADIEHLLSFEDTFPGTKVVLLEQNYRSSKTIITASNEVIAKNQRRHEKNLFTENEDGEPITLYGAHSEADEAQFVASTAEALMEDGTPPGEIAVLYRANFQSRALEEALINAGVPYRVLGTRFFERKEVKDVLSYLRAALNPESRVDIARIVGTPSRGIGKQTLTRMLASEENKLTPAAQKKVVQFRELLARIKQTAETKPVSEALRTLVRESGLEAHLMQSGEEGQERLENIRELVTLATKYDEEPPPIGAEKLIEDAALLGEQDNLDKAQEAISLMTVHASKGLEFDAVFVTGLEAGLFPLERAGETEDPEEERRLFYVALTRARKKVYLTHAFTRMMYGTRDIAVPSEFLDDIDPAHIENAQSDMLPKEDKVDLIDW